MLRPTNQQAPGSGYYQQRFAKIPGNGARTVDLNNFADFNQESSWANGKVVEGVLAGDADGSLRPNDALTRAEAYTLFMRLLRQLGW